MRRIACAFLTFTMVAVFGPVATAEPPEGEGWRSLFNGADLTGWHMTAPHEGIWTVKDGVIDCRPRADLAGEKSLWTDESFGDFVFHAEWRIKETKGEYPIPVVMANGLEKRDAQGNVITKLMANADSGVYLRGSSKSQVNIWCWPVGSGEVYGYRTDASMPPEVRAGVTPSSNADKPVGEWNTFVITMRGDRLTVELNGTTVLDNAKLPGVPERGPIALQHHGGYDPRNNSWNPASSLVQFRNIYIRELP